MKKNLPFYITNPKNVLVLKKDKPNLIYNLAQQYFSFMTPTCRYNCVLDLFRLEIKKRDNITVYES